MAAIAAFGITSCGDPTDMADSPAAVLRNIVIGDELLVGSSSGGSRSTLSELKDNSAEVPLYLQSSSRGTICLYFLKYGLSKHPDLQTKDDFGRVIDWGIFKNDEHSYGSETEKYLEEYWADIKEKIYVFDMGKLTVNETADGKYEVIQVDPGKAFMHYIVLTPTAYGTYDIDFYAVEVMGPKPDVYYEQTKFTSASNFTIKRIYYNVPSSMHFFDDAKNGISSLRDAGQSSVYDFVGKNMHGLQKFFYSEEPTFEESFTDFVYAAKKDNSGIRYGIFRNNGTLVYKAGEGYAVNFLEGSAEITDGMKSVYKDEGNNISCVLVKPQYVGGEIDIKCTVDLNFTYLDTELGNADNLKSSLLTCASVEGLSDAVNVLNETYAQFFSAVD